jgi:hypothetical protein
MTLNYAPSHSDRSHQLQLFCRKRRSLVRQASSNFIRRVTNLTARTPIHSGLAKNTGSRKCLARMQSRFVW